MKKLGPNQWVSEVIFAAWLISDWWRRLFYVVVEPPTGNILVKLLVPKNLSSANNNTGVHRPPFDGAPVEVARAWRRPPGKWSRTRSRENYGLHPCVFCPGHPLVINIPSLKPTAKRTWKLDACKTIRFPFCNAILLRVSMLVLGGGYQL